MTINQGRLTLLGLFFSLFVHGQNAWPQKQGTKELIPAGTAPERKWWNLLRYKIDITPDYGSKYISGTNTITFAALQAGTVLQIELQAPMRMVSVQWRGKNLALKQGKEATYFITFPTLIKAGEKQTITIQFDGSPRESVKPPYDSGWIWAKDEKGRPWISVACEGSGASIWLPCKEVLYDEPDNGVSFSITVPDTLTAIANGRLTNKASGKKGTTTYTWSVVNPINNYNIIPYIGNYVSWHRNYAGVIGKLDCDYWVLDYNLAKAKRHFNQTDTLLKAFEYWAGPYPFYEDGYKVVEAPMPGMEHQSALAYGNGFQNGLNGKDLISKSGWGLAFDFVLVHESGHEWFGNSITANTNSDSWLHEGFTKYLETLYTSFVFGIEAGNDYAVGTWKRIKNDEPIIGTTTTDQYYKGSALLHMIRQIIGDTLFRKVLTGLNKAFYHRTVSTAQVLAFLNQATGRDFTKLFDQYLTTVQVPRLGYSFKDKAFRYRWESCVANFSMPVRVSLDGTNYKFIFPTTAWQTESTVITNSDNFKVDRNFYITAGESN